MPPILRNRRTPGSRRRDYEPGALWAASAAPSRVHHRTYGGFPEQPALRADRLLRGHFRGKLIVIAHRNHSIAKSEGEKHLGNIRHGGDDALWRRRGL